MKIEKKTFIWLDFYKEYDFCKYKLLYFLWEETINKEEPLINDIHDRKTLSYRIRLQVRTHKHTDIITHTKCTIITVTITINN